MKLLIISKFNDTSRDSLQTEKSQQAIQKQISKLVKEGKTGWQQIGLLLGVALSRL